MKMKKITAMSMAVSDMYPEFWTHIYKLGGHHGCFSVFYRRHPFCLLGQSPVYHCVVFR